MIFTYSEVLEQLKSNEVGPDPPDGLFALPIPAASRPLRAIQVERILTSSRILGECSVGKPDSWQSFTALA